MFHQTRFPPVLATRARSRPAPATAACDALLAARAFGLIKGFGRSKVEVMAIELAFKSLALRSGATVNDCKKASHNISKMISLIQKHQVKIPELLDRKLNCDQSFKNRLFGTRYPVFDPNEVITYHKNYPEMIAEILEIPCSIPLKFKGGTAMEELKQLVADLKTTD